LPVAPAASTRAHRQADRSEQLPVRYQWHAAMRHFVTGETL
jgi:hypothetical protein